MPVVHEYVEVRSCDLESMKEALKIGPVAAAVDSSDSGWISYQGGIISSENCSANINEGVLIVGFKDDYFIVKNFHGTSWGEDGYARLSIVGNDGCGA
jgi:hypothetical protein